MACGACAICYHDPRCKCAHTALSLRSTRVYRVVCRAVVDAARWANPERNLPKQNIYYEH